MLLAGDQLNAEEARNLQDRLAQLDSQYKNKALDQQGKLGQADIDLRRYLGDQQGSLGRADIDTRRYGIDASSNLGLLQALLQNNQFGRSLDQNSAQFGANMDLQGILGLLGGMR
jgi:hypothetical protein